MQVDQSKLEKVVAVTIPQKIKELILGKQRPNLLTRVSVAFGFLVWIYLFSWHVLTFMTLKMMSSLKPGWRRDVVPAFQKVGFTEYKYHDTVDLMNTHCLGQFVVYFLMLFGLILIWRKKKLGFIIYPFAAISSLIITYVVMGQNYFIIESTLTDLVLIIGSALYFGIGAWWFYKYKEREKKDDQEARNDNQEQVSTEAG